MTMYAIFNSLVFLSIIISINGQRDEGRDLPREQYSADRMAKTTFDTQFSRGQCPPRFYQVGNECLYFATDGPRYRWNQADRACSQRIGDMVNRQPYDIYQPNSMGQKAVRQLVLNTPEKTQIFQALSREYEERNFAVRLPSDYNTLQRCDDGNDDNWPRYCPNPQNPNATCFETTSEDRNNVCLREVDCRRDPVRLACQFTLSGNQEITTSTFRTCPKASGSRRRLPLWAWVIIAVGSILLLVAIIVVVLGVLRKSKKGKGTPKKNLPDPDNEAKRIPPTHTHTDPATEPMLIKPAPTHVTDTGYLQPRSSGADNTPNA